MKRYYALYVTYDSEFGKYTRPTMALSNSTAIDRYVRRAAGILEAADPPIGKDLSEASRAMLRRAASSAFIRFCKSVNILKAGRFNEETGNVEMYDIYEPLGSLWNLLPGDLRSDVESEAVK